MKIFLFFAALLFVTTTRVETAAVARCKLDENNACKDYSTASSCRTINYCKVEIWNKPPTKTEICGMCMKEIENLQNFVKADSTKKFVEHSLMALCKKIQSPIGRNECKLLVWKNFNQIYQDVVENLNAQTVCRALHICNSDSVQYAVSDLDMDRLISESLEMPVLMNDGCDQDSKCEDYKSAKKCNALNECKSSTWLLPIKDDEVCELCREEVGKLQDLVKQQATKQEVKEETLKLCDKIPISVLKEECHKIVVDDFDLIYDDLVAALDPDILCTALKLCNAASVEDMTTASCKLDGNNACLDYYMAAKCDSVDYCKLNVWNKPVQSSDLCDLCLHDIGSLRKFLDANLTKELIQADLLALCKAIPIQKYSYRCQTMVIKNFERIYDDIVNAIDPKTICRAISFCSSVGEGDAFAKTSLKKLETSLAIDEPQCVEPCQDLLTAKKCGVTSTCIAMVWSGPVKDDEICTFCKEEITKLQDWLKKATTKAEIEKELTDFCKRIPLSVFSDECSKLVTEDFSAIYDIIVDGLAPSGVCAAMKLCQQVSAEKHVKEMMEKLPAILQKAVDAKRIPMAAPFAADKHTLPSLKKNEEDACSDCEAFVKDFQKTVINNKKVLNDWIMMLNKECDALGEGIGSLCKELVNQYIPQILKQISNLDPKAVCQKIMMCEAINQKRLGDMCTDCKTFFTEWQNMLKANSSIADNLDDMIASECSSLGDGLKEMCTSLLKKNLPQLWNIIEMTDVGKICTRLEFCDKKVSDLRKFAQKVSKVIVEALPKHEPKVTSDYCSDCHNFVGDLQGVIKNNQSIVQELVDLVKQECDQLGELSEVCKTFVDQVAPVIEDAITSNDVDSICTTIEMCGGKVQRVGGDLCTDCTAFFTDWQAIITNNQSIVNELNDLITQQCDSLGPEFTKLCSTFVKEYLPQLWDLISYTDAGTICSTLYFCEDKSLIEAENKNEIVKAEGDDCTDCHNFITDLQGVIKNNQSIVQELVDLVKQECYQLGELSQVDVGTVCSTIMMCGENEKRVGGDLCTDCTAFFSDWQQIIVNNQSVICGRILNQENSKLLMDIQQMDAGTVCSTLYFCEEKSLEKVEDEKPQVTGDDCTDCHNFISDLQGVITNNQSIVQELVDLVKQECYQLGELSEVCKTFVGQVAPVIEDAISSNDVGTVCSTIMMCGQTQKRVGGDLCTDCSAFFTDWQNIIANNQSIINELNGLITQECDSLGPEFSKLCSTFVKEYLPQLWDLISSSDAETICSTLYFCSDVSPLKIENKNSKTNVHESLKCEECRFAIEEVEKMIQGNKTEESIASALSEVCNLYGEDIREECKTFMQQNSAQLIDFLLAEMNAQHICQEIGLCEKSMRQKLGTAKIEQSVKGEVECEFCELLITEVDKLISDNATQTEILNEIGKICQYLGKEEDECNTIVHEYGPEILTLIAQELTPAEICSLIKLCPKKSAVTKAKSSLECEVCTLIAQELEKLLTENSTKDEIEAALKEVCSVLSSDFQKTCDGLVIQYGPQIVEILVEEMNPGVICVKLELCEGSNVAKKADFPFECMLCEQVVEYLDKMINYSSTEKEIIDALDKVCDAVKSVECREFVDKYGAYIVKLILEGGTSPRLICSALGACTVAEATELPYDKGNKLESEIDCEVCQLVAEGLESLLMENSTQAEIEAALEKVCSILPEAVKSDCDNLIETYGAEIIQLLIEEMNPSKICVTIKLCSGTFKLLPEADLCEVCKMIAKELDDMLAEKTTQDAIEDALMKVCNILPAEFKAACDDIIKSNYLRFMELLIKEMNPAVICPDLKLCPKALPKEKVNSESCDVCKLVAQELDQLLMENSTEAEIEMALEEVCAILPSQYQKDCDSLIQEVGPEIVKLLVEEMKPEKICSDLGLCPKDKAVVKKGVNSDTDCEVCKLVATELDKVLMQNSTEAEIEKALEEVCAILPSQYQKDCDSLIQEVGPEIVKLLLEEMKPEKICSDLGLCPKDKAVVKDGVNSDTDCQVCKLVATELDKILMQNSTEAEIEKAFEKVCTVLPSQYQAECRSLVREYGPEIVELLANEMEPEHICPELGLCPKDKIVVKVSSELTCELCQAVLIALDNLLEENSTVEEIEAAVKEVCTILPESIKEDCSNLIQQYGDTIVQLLIEQITPAKICPLLELCPKPSEEKIPKIKMNGFVKCDICRIVMGELEKILDEQSTDKEIIDAVNKVCDIIPESYRSTCHEYINDYGPGVIAILLDDFVPGKVCKTLKLCQTSSVEEIPLKLHVRSDEKCVICKEIIHELDVILKNNYTQAAIEAALESLCDKVPSELSSECKSLVEEYAPIIFKYADKVLDPSFICLKMKLCSTDVQKPILGLDPCTYGPAFWCRDLDTAKRCNAVEHCMNHIWDEN